MWPSGLRGGWRSWGWGGGVGGSGVAEKRREVKEHSICSKSDQAARLHLMHLQLILYMLMAATHTHTYTNMMKHIAFMTHRMIHFNQHTFSSWFTFTSDRDIVQPYSTHCVTTSCFHLVAASVIKSVKKYDKHSVFMEPLQQKAPQWGLSVDLLFNNKALKLHQCTAIPLLHNHHAHTHPFTSYCHD